jgi:Mn-dependent DtxR family transcriptional regulator
MTPLDARPQPFAQVAQTVKDLAPPGREIAELVVEGRQLVEELLALAVEAETNTSREACLIAHGKCATLAVVVR